MIKIINKKIFQIAFIFTFVLANVSFACASEITAAKMFELTNKSRAESGLDPLENNEKLTLAAQYKLDDMFKNQYFDHISPEGVTPWHWFDIAGYDYFYAAENLAMDFSSAEGAHSALMKSTGHRENILCIKYKEIGIAVASGKFNGKDSIIIVEEFGTEREQKVELITDAFFESVEVVAEEVKKENIPAEKPIPVNVTVLEKNKEEENIVNVPVQIEDKRETVDNPKTDLENQTEKYGKVMPKMYSIRSVKTLKKVYIEDIYWTEGIADESFYSVESAAEKIRSILSDLTNFILLSVMR